MKERIRVVYYPAPPRAFSADELAAVFARHDGQDDILCAVRFLLQERLAQATAAAATASLSDREAAHAGGRIEELTSFAEELARRVAQEKAWRGQRPGPGGLGKSGTKRDKAGQSGPGA